MNLNPIDCAYTDCAAYYDRLILQTKCKIQDNCAICFDTLVNRSIIYLPCKHYFHANCIKQTFENEIYTCPLCRYDLMNSLKKVGHKFNEENDNEVWKYFLYSYYYTRAGEGASEAGEAGEGASEAGASEAVDEDEDWAGASASEAGAGAGAGAGEGAWASAEDDEAGAGNTVRVRTQTLDDYIRTYYDDNTPLMVRNYIIYYVL